MYRFALRPRWLLSHLFALTLVVLFVNLGFWQLGRHDERVDRNAEVTARSDQAPVPVDSFAGADPDDVRYRPVTVAGTYEDAILVVDNRSFDGLPGGWVVSPLRQADGSVVAVSRGFVGFTDGAVDAPAPPAGAVDVTGTATTWAERACGTRTDDAGSVVGAACLSQAAAEQAFGAEVLPIVVQQASSSPPDADALTPVPLPELGTGPHRSYAVQWFIFATIGAGGYPLILRKVARDRQREVSA